MCQPAGTSPAAAWMQQSAGRWAVTLSLPSSGGSIKLKNSLSAPLKSDHFNHCKHLLCFVSQRPDDLCYTQSSPGPRHKQTLHPARQTAETRGPVPGEVIMHRECRSVCVCVCVVGSYSSLKMKTAALKWHFKRTESRLQLDHKTQKPHERNKP